MSRQQGRQFGERINAGGTLNPLPPEQGLQPEADSVGKDIQISRAGVQHNQVGAG